MTPCPAVEDLRQFLDEATGEWSAVARHIDNCEKCQVLLDQLTEASFLDGSTSQSLPAWDECGLDVSQLLPGLRSDSAIKRDDIPTGQLPGYTFLSYIGSGAGGDVFRAKDEQLGRIVAIKILKAGLAGSPENLARFEREARATAALEEEHIVRLHALLLPDNFPPSLVFEYIEGESLKDHLQRQEVIPPQEAVRIAIGIATGLAAAHRVGVIHRDIKPSNVLIATATNRIKIADFGLARFIESEHDNSVEGTLAGTPSYMSPEQIQEPQNVDARSDLYSLGVLLYEVLTGVLPYRGPLRMVLQRRIHEDPQSLRLLNDAIPRDLETICLKAMSRDPARRYQTGLEFIDDLQRWERGRPILARPVSLLEKVWRWSRRNPAIARLSVLVGILLLSSFVGLSWFTAWLAESKWHAESLTQEAHDQAQHAETQRDLALKHLDQMVYEVQNELAARPETRALRKRLLEIALQGLIEVQLTGDFSITGAIGTADALNRLGELANELNDFESARDHFQHALDHLLDLPANYTHQGDTKRAMAMTLCNLGDAQRQLSEHELAESHYLKATALLHGLVDSKADGQPLTDRGLAIAHERLGDLYRDQARWNEAARQYAQSVQFLETRPLPNAEPFTAKRDVAVILQKQGTVELQLNHNDTAADLQGRGHQLLQDILAQDQTGFQSRRDVAVSFSRLAEIKVRQENTEAAYDDFQESSRLLEELMQQDPQHVGLLRDLASTRSRQGEIAYALKRLDEADRHLSAAVILFECLIASDRGRTEDRVSLERCRQNLQLIANPQP